jgi:hypothetical protein
MIGLGIQGDVPTDSVQQKLVDGIHLRWSFLRERGFPWYGYFLFRRPYRRTKPVCLAGFYSHIKTDVWTSGQLNTAYGEFSSDRNLVFTDDFPSEGANELDLRARKYLRFTIGPHEPAYRIEVQIGIRGPEESNSITAGVEVKALSSDLLIAQQTVLGQPGEIVKVTLSASSISGIEISGGDAALVELCLYSVSQNSRSGWEFVPDFEYPMCLPVRHANYPCSAQPANLSASEGTGLARVLYGPPDKWAGQPFKELHEQLGHLVEDGPAGPLAMSQKSSTVADTATPPGTEVGPPKSISQYPLDLVLIAGLHPAIAQMLGLYWVDQSVPPNEPFDYLIVADHTGIGNKNPAGILEVIRAEGFINLDGYIVFNQRMQTAPVRTPPTGMQCYALPGTTITPETGTLLNGTNNVGLRWDLESLSPGVIKPDGSIMYIIWRGEGGNKDAPAPATDYQLLTSDAVLVPEPVIPPGLSPVRPPDWPPFALHYIDNGLADGWYSYRVAGIDIFGRHTPQSADARWLQWIPEPRPRPWYYQDPPAESVVHPSAVRLLDKIGPPPPQGVEAYALDPADPTLMRDAVYNNWFDALSNVERESLIGLRVRWRWTDEHMRQAPDTREFRIYLQPDALNSMMGRITSVTPASATQTDVQTDLINIQGVNAYTGAWLRVGANAFNIVSSNGSNSLTLRVRNIGSANEVMPSAGVACTLTIPQIYNSSSVSVQRGSVVVTGSNTLWTPNLVGMTFKVVGEFAVYSIAAVNSPAELVLERGYAEPDATNQPYGIRFPLFTDFSIPISWQERFYVVPFDEHVVVTVDSAGRTLRKYELIIPFGGDTELGGDTERRGLQLVTSPTVPVRYAQVGVTAADDKEHTADDPKWAVGVWGGLDRFGNEGPVSAPSKIFIVRRTPPPAPTVPPDSDRVFASRADYHGHSFYLYRWVPSANLKTHIFRALDDTLFKTDWERRGMRTSDLDPNSTEQFPSEWDMAKRTSVANELNHLNTFDHDSESAAAMSYYRNLSNDGLRTLAGLAGNDRAFAQLTIAPLDPDEAAYANRLGPEDPPNLIIDPDLRAYTDTLDGCSTNRYFYRAAYVDAAHNRSPLSLASPPIYCHNVVPPRVPIITKTEGGDRQIRLRWSSNREDDLTAYRVYRSESKDASREVRLMTVVDTLIVAHVEPALRPAEVEWTDDDVKTRVPLYYRVAAIDDAGNVSNASLPVAVQSYDDSRPSPPVWGPSAPTNEGLHLTWILDDDSHFALVQRRDTTVYPTQWMNLTSWLGTDTQQIVDKGREVDRTYVYRIRVRDVQGVLNRDFLLLEI